MIAAQIAPTGRVAPLSVPARPAGGRSFAPYTRGPGVLLQTAQATMALAQFFGDVVDAARLGDFDFVLFL